TWSGTAAPSASPTTRAPTATSATSTAPRIGCRSDAHPVRAGGPMCRYPLAACTTFALLLALPATAPTAGGEAPGPAQAELQRQARRCRHILKASLIDFYLPACVDQIHGGYLESLKGGKFVATGERFLTLQARQLWFFS